MPVSCCCCTVHCPLQVSTTSDGKLGRACDSLLHKYFHQIWTLSQLKYVKYLTCLQIQHMELLPTTQYSSTLNMNKCSQLSTRIISFSPDFQFMFPFENIFWGGPYPDREAAGRQGTPVWPSPEISCFFRSSLPSNHFPHWEHLLRFSSDQKAVRRRSSSAPHTLWRKVEH